MYIYIYGRVRLGVYVNITRAILNIHLNARAVVYTKIVRRNILSSMSVCTYTRARGMRAACGHI